MGEGTVRARSPQDDASYVWRTLLRALRAERVAIAGPRARALLGDYPVQASVILDPVRGGTFGRVDGAAIDGDGDLTRLCELVQASDHAGAKVIAVFPPEADVPLADDRWLTLTTARLGLLVRTDLVPMDPIVTAVLRDAVLRLPEPVSRRASDSPYERLEQAHARAFAERLPRRLVDILGVAAGHVEPASAAGLRTVFVLSGVPPGGSGGSHSIAQECAGLRVLGVDARIAVPTQARERTEALYGDLVPIDGNRALTAKSARADVLVATDFRSVALLRALADGTRTGHAYYVQDYEPFFHAPGSEPADAALLSYRALSAAVPFVKTRWLAGVLAARHALHASVVCPSIDHSVFSPPAEASGGRRLRVSAMVRVTTPRRRPFATLSLLHRLHIRHSDEVQVVAFGSSAKDFRALNGGEEPEVENLGILSRTEVRDLLRKCDAFLDLSIYQAFGRTAAEAAACGCAVVVPRLGGIREWAVHGVSALVCDGDREDQVVDAVLSLARSPARRHAISAGGLQAARRFTVEQAAATIASVLVAAAGPRPAQPADGSEAAGHA